MFYQIPQQQSQYPEHLVAPMAQELTDAGFESLHTAADVDTVLDNTEGSVLVVVNSVCGCAAGGVRPGIAMALQNAENKPDRVITVFAGADIDATETAREYFTGYMPSSPAIGFLKGGKLVQLFERKDLEGRPPTTIAQSLVDAFNNHCAKTEAANN